MKSIDDVNLIIFDLHGTVADSSRPMYAAVEAAFAGLGWPVEFSEAEIGKYMGASSDEFYQLIVPAARKDRWREGREAVHRTAGDAFIQHGATFPGVKETLETLRQRGYRLALYSNSAGVHMAGVIRALGIGGLFDYIKSPADDALDKTGLAGKIASEYRTGTAIVGDEIDDITAARQTGSFCVGALYGYGGDESYQADVTINEFKELLEIFKER
jgi:phosphoglycolate phosphatase-like HAD superfamily hydrolase